MPASNNSSHRIIPRLLTAALAAFPLLPAEADPGGVTLYGILDAGFANVEHQGNFTDNYAATVNPYTPVKGTVITSTASVSGVANGGIQDSRWGIRGDEPLDGGSKVIFTLESGIDLPSGQLNNNEAALAAGGTNNATGGSGSGQLFNRQAWAGLEDPLLGRLTVGFQYMPIYEVLRTYDNQQFSQLFSPLGFSGAYNGGIGISEESRQGGSLRYSKAWAGFNLTALYKFGGISGEPGGHSGYGVNLGYERAGFGIQGVYERIYDGTKGASSALPGGSEVTAQTLNSVGYLIGLHYLPDGLPFAVRGGYESYQLSNGDFSASQLGTTQLYGETIANPTTSNHVLLPGAQAATHLLWIGGDYSFTSRDKLGLGLYGVHVASAANYAGVADKGQAGYDARYTSVLYDHQLSVRTDLYVGAVFAEFGGFGASYGMADTYSGNRLLMAGLRTRF